MVAQFFGMPVFSLPTLGYFFINVGQFMDKQDKNQKFG
jgi:hypothetical protein